ncbi:MAG: Uma2 family endonuclease [Elainellaceae cyanobacterium]
MAIAAHNLQSPVATPYRWTSDRYRMAVDAGIFEGQPLELLDGALIEMVPEGISHAGLSSDGADYLRALLGGRVKVREAKPITLPNDSEPEPDIAVVKPLGEVYRTERHPIVADIFWVIEYSDTSLEKDLQLKTRIYAQAAIAEYWVVDLKARELIVFRDPVGESYESRRVMVDGVVCPVSFPAVDVAVERLV